MKRSRGLEDSWLLKLWRRKVLAEYENRCFFCGASADVVSVQCHHVVKRRTLLLRYDWRNGIPLCEHANQYNTQFKGMSCHQYADTPAGRDLILKNKKKHLAYLTDRSGVAKQFFVDHGITEREFLETIKKELVV